MNDKAASKVAVPDVIIAIEDFFNMSCEFSYVILINSCQPFLSIEKIDDFVLKFLNIKEIRAAILPNNNSFAYLQDTCVIYSLLIGNNRVLSPSYLAYPNDE